MPEFPLAGRRFWLLRPGKVGVEGGAVGRYAVKGPLGKRGSVSVSDIYKGNDLKV